jgi:Mg-chelatase subunit ChlD
MDRPTHAEGRGQSGMIGFVIVVSLVVTGAVLVVVAGSAALADLQQERTDSEARFVMEEVDSQLTTVTSSDQSATGQLSLGDLDGQASRVVRQGSLNVTVNQRHTCRTNVTLSSIRYESDDGETVAYQAGGVFVAGDGGSAVQTPPDVQFRNGSLDVTVTNITGQVSDSRTEVFYNATSSGRESTRHSSKVISGACIRPDNVTVSVRSDFYRAWGTHLREELDASADRTVFGNGTVRTSGNGTVVWTDPGNRTATAYVNQSRLPRRTDDERNQVVNMSNPDYMDVVVVGNRTNPQSNNTVRVSKGVANDYSVYVEPLAQKRLYIGEVRDIEGVTNVTGPPRDVTFVLDESGSMSFSAPGATDRTAAAQTAIKNFVATLNASRDRVGLVGYSSDIAWNGGAGCFYGDGTVRPRWAPSESSAWIYATDGRYLTSAYDAFNGTVDATTSRCGTAGSAGLSKGNQLLHLKSNQTRQQVVIFLSDGEFNEDDMSGVGPNEAAEQRARISKSQGATIYSVGFGERTDINESVLREMADRTGGDYFFAANQQELVEVFLNISQQTAVTNQLALTPTATNISTGNGGVFAPQIPGDTDDVASVTQNGQRFANINDPTAPVHFTHSFAVADDEAVRFNASTFSCDQWSATNRAVTNTSGNDTESYQVVRCSEINQTRHTLSPDSVSIYTDGDNIDALVADEADSPWWRRSIERAITNRSRDEIAVENRSGDRYLRADSNLAVVVLDYPDAPNSTNKLALLYRIGRAESEARADDVVNIRVRNVRADP